MQSGNVPVRKPRKAASIEDFLLRPGSDERAFEAEFASSKSRHAALASRKRSRASLITKDSSSSSTKNKKDSGPALVLRDSMTIESRDNDPEALGRVFDLLRADHESLCWFESQRDSREAFFASIVDCLKAVALRDRHRHFFVSSKGGPGVPEYEAVFAYDEVHRKVVACLSASSKYLRRFLWDFRCEFGAAHRDDNEKLGNEFESFRQSKEIDAEMGFSRSADPAAAAATDGNASTRIDKRPLVFFDDNCTKLLYALVQTSDRRRFPVVRAFFPFRSGVCKKLEICPPVVSSRVNEDGDPIRVVRIENSVLLPGNYVSLAKILLACGEDCVVKDRVSTKAFLQVKALPRITQKTSFSR